MNLEILNGSGLAIQEENIRRLKHAMDQEPITKILNLATNQFHILLEFVGKRKVLRVQVQDTINTKSLILKLCLVIIKH